jgi:hypothetical protein
MQIQVEHARNSFQHAPIVGTQKTPKFERNVSHLMLTYMFIMALKALETEIVHYCTPCCPFHVDMSIIYGMRGGIWQKHM